MPIKAVCSNCDRVYNVADQMAGKKLKCKECGEAFKVKSPLAARGRQREDDEEDDRPRRKTKAEPEKKGGGMVWLLVGGGVAALLVVVLVGGGLVAAYFLWPNKATPENFAKIREGMSEKEVVAIMGSPRTGISMNNGFTRFAGMNMPNIKELVWSGKNNYEFVVVLDEDKVIMKLGTDGRHVQAGSGEEPWGGFQPNGGFQPPPVNPFGGGTSANLGNFHRVRMGMTEGEVVAIMGNPTTTLSSAPNQKALFWNGSNGDSVNVGVKDGRVFMGGGAINGQPVNLAGGR